MTSPTSTPVSPSQSHSAEGGQLPLMVLTRSQSADRNRTSPLPTPVVNDPEEVIIVHGPTSPTPLPTLTKGANTVMNDVNCISRDRGIHVESLGKTFPAPSLYDDADPTDKDPDNKKLWGAAPWFDRDALDLPNLLECYTNDEDELPGEIPLVVTRSWAWRHQFSVSDHGLRVSYGRPISALRGNFALSANNGLNRLRSMQVIAEDLDMDFFVYRTTGEYRYVEALVALDDEVIESWRNTAEVDQRALLMDGPQLYSNFRFLRKNSNYWKEGIRGERRARSMTGRALPYQNLCQFDITDDEVAGGWPLLTRAWGQYEVPRGCTAELPPIFTYKPHCLMDQSSGLWVIAYTGFAAKTACYILQEVYDHYRLWSLSKAMLAAIDRLDLRVVLGSQHNVDELVRLLDVIRSTDFNAVSSSWQIRGKRTYEYSPGRRVSGGDFIYYDPWSRRKLTEAQHTILSRQPRRRIPHGYPTGFDFSIDTSTFFDENGNVVVQGDTGAQDASGGWGDTVTAAAGSSNNNGPAPSGSGVQPTQVNLDDVDEDEITPDVGGNFINNDAPSGPSSMPYYAYGQTPNTQMPYATGSYQQPIQLAGGVNPHMLIYNLTVVRQFLREVGVPEQHLQGGWDELKGYLRGRFG